MHDEKYDSKIVYDNVFKEKQNKKKLLALVDHIYTYVFLPNNIKLLFCVFFVSKIITIKAILDTNNLDLYSPKLF